MICISTKLTNNYAIEISCLHKVRNFKDGISFVDGEISLDLYPGDHNPKFRLDFIFMNYTILEVGVYNMNHKQAE